VRAEINSHQFGLHSGGSAEFQAAVARIHGLLFGDGSTGAPAHAGPGQRFAAAGAQR
jgi:NitT/TauT family transport system ATP-binding protein